MTTEKPNDINDLVDQIDDSIIEHHSIMLGSRRARMFDSSRAMARLRTEGETLLWFFSLARGAGRPGANPLAARAWRYQLRADQLLMLGGALLVVAVVTFMMRAQITSRPSLIAYIISRWGVGEFFWIWMAADHLFTTVMSWRRRRAWEELQATLLTPQEKAEGFLGPSLLFLSIALMLYSALDILLPFGPNARIFSNPSLTLSSGADLLLWRAGLAAGFCLSGFGTLAMAVVWSFYSAAECDIPDVHVTWFSTLVRCFAVSLGLDALGFILGSAFVALGVLCLK